MDISFDVVFVGAGPASLAGAIHLKNLAKVSSGDLSVAVIEKAPNLGDQILSGATFDPRALAELIPNYAELDPPLGPKVKKESLSFLLRNHRIQFPFVPPTMSNKGKHLLSLSDFVRWLGKQAESAGIEIFTGESVEELIEDNSGAVIGVQIKGKGLDKDGKPKPNLLPPTKIGAKVVVVGEGSRGHVAKQLIEKRGLDEGCTPQGYAIGLKELWEVREDRFVEGSVYNAMGYPVPLSEFGGGFVYHLSDRKVAVGMVVGLDYKNPHLHSFDLLQRFKAHPFINRMLEGGRFISYGAKTIAEGGLYAMPKSYGDGFIIIGEAGGILDAMKLKGVDLVMKSGMCAAETIAAALKSNDFSEKALGGYEELLKNSWVGKSLNRARNFHQGFHKGIIPGMIHTAFQTVTAGRGLIDRFKVEADWRCMKELSVVGNKAPEELKPDGRITFDKLTCVFGSGTKHEEDQPCHIQVDDFDICNGRCKKEFGNPCVRFCPANVFEMVEEEDGETRLHLNPSNCLHCKTCDIKDPYAVVTWNPPEGGGGPNYKGM
jgi:electron-transferring-flavoprotein dehydrogenase